MEPISHAKFNGNGLDKCKLGVNKIGAFNSERYTRLELFCRSKSGKAGSLSLIDKNGKKLKYAVDSGYYKRLILPLIKNTDYEILLSDIDVSISYLSGSDNIMEDGVCFIEFDIDVKKIAGSLLSDFYDTPYREQYHFAPFKNWANDPNGLCWYKGKYHLFYQANPNSQEWDDMYWGHAASPDLIHWVHLPLVFEPQRELFGNPLIKGGAFSGSAVAFENEVLFYFTRHIGPKVDCAQTKEWQVFAKSSDMLTFEKERTIISEKPKGVEWDFRDPKVFFSSGIWYMALASNLNGDPTILLYSSDDMYNWKYENPLVVEKIEKCASFECPDCFELDGKFVAVGALLNHLDEHKRKTMTKYYIGDFADRKLNVQATGWYDFGSNFYAVQSFEHEGRRIAIGWICDSYFEHIKVKDGVCGSFSIPRVVSVRNNRLYMVPVPEIYFLKDKLIYSGKSEAVSFDNIKGNSYYAKLEFSKSTDFNILLGKSGDSSISLQRAEGVTKIKTVGVKSEDAEFTADVEDIADIEIFVDRRVVEVYINQGFAAGTKLFYNQNKYGIFSAKFDEPEAISNIEIFTMKSIW